jgi:hypothetical protein
MFRSKQSVVVVGLVVLLGGCSANYWGGKTSGERPGMKVKKSAFGVEFDLTSNNSSGAKKIEIKTAKGDSISIEDMSINQNTSDVVKEEPAKILAIAEVQRTQGEYVEKLTTGIRGIVSEVFTGLAPFLNILASAKIQKTSTGINLELPGGLKIGGTKTTEPAEISKYLVDLSQKVQKAKIALDESEKNTTTQPVTTQPVAKSAPLAVAKP